MFPCPSAGAIKHTKKTFEQNSSTSLKKQPSKSEESSKDDGFILRVMIAALSDVEDQRGRLGLYKSQRARLVLSSESNAEYGGIFGPSPYMSAQGNSVSGFFESAIVGWTGRMKLFRYCTKNGTVILNYKYNSWLIEDEFEPVQVLPNWISTFQVEKIVLNLTSINVGYYCHCLQFRYQQDGTCRSCKVPRYASLEANIHETRKVKIIKSAEDQEPEFFMLSGQLKDGLETTQNIQNILMNDVLTAVDTGVVLSEGKTYTITCLNFTGYLKLGVFVEVANESKVKEIVEGNEGECKSENI